MLTFKDYINEGVSRKNPEDILKYADIYSKEDSARRSMEHLVKPQNYTLVKDLETNKFLVITNKETGILVRSDKNRFEKLR